MFRWLIFSGLFLFGIYGTSQSQKPKSAKENQTVKKDTTKTDSVKLSLKDKVKSSVKLEGLFTFYQDTQSGSLHIYLNKNQLNKEFLYQSFSMGGPAELFLNQNMLRETWLFSVRKNFDRIFWMRSNTSFYFDKNHPISKAANVDVPETIFFSEKIVAEDSMGYLVNVDNLFLSERLDPIRPYIPSTIPASAYLNLGTLNKDKSEYLKIRTFPLNSDVVVNLSYENPNPQYFGGLDITDPRYVNVRMQHSFLELPVNDFQPRVDHPHIGYFNVQTEDMTSTHIVRYRDFINRWHLKKKYPEQAISEPVEPIVWWVENTTPKELRQVIIDAGHKWNAAFEKAGFKNAIEMKMMPDDVDWDPADIRYNVIRWVSSDLGFAIGPSFVNPRTGQILGSDITIDFSFLTGTKIESDLFEHGKVMEEFEEIQAHPHSCKLGAGLRMQNQFGNAMLEIQDADHAEKTELLHQFITELVLHEMGHTLGLNHNMKSSHMLSPAELKNKEITRKFGVTGSVMDYSTINLALKKEEQADYYTTVVGPYDLWAIEYGYTPFSKENEAKGLQAIVNKSTDPKLIFGNDADICRPGGGIDPRVMVWDMSNDPITYAAERFEIVENGMASLKSKFIKENQSYEVFKNMYFVLFYQRFNMTRSVANYIGGVYVDRSFPGQKTENKPYTPVSKSEQKRALELISRYVFSPNALSKDQSMYQYLQSQRRGFNFWGNSEDPKLDALVSNMYYNVLYPILSPSTLRRLNNTSMYGNNYSVHELLEDLTAAIFNEDLSSNVNMYRKSLQQIYVERLINVYENKAQNFGIETKSSSYDALSKLRKSLKKSKAGDGATKAHRSYLVKLIENSLKIED
ncbi:MAG: zinc-dependent metalloprotease [Saprospiraceae bacterium]|nr:zinc-dependent metalloprotease [Saprospiraceae bacterium]